MTKYREIQRERERERDEWTQCNSRVKSPQGLARAIAKKEWNCGHKSRRVLVLVMDYILQCVSIEINSFAHIYTHTIYHTTCRAQPVFTNVEKERKRARERETESLCVSVSECVCVAQLLCF